jgi:hypothetical protein
MVIKMALVKYLAACILVIACFTTQAATVVLDGSGTNATGILNLGIDPDGAGSALVAFYDVSFEFTSIGLTPDALDAFATSGVTQAAAVAYEIAAGAAVDAIVTALNSSAAVSAGTRYNIYVPWLYDDQTNGPNKCDTLCSWVAKSAFFPGQWSVLPGETSTGGQIEFARFTPAAPVPLPPAVLLFGSGLAFLGWVRSTGVRPRVW